MSAKCNAPIPAIMRVWFPLDSSCQLFWGVPSTKYISEVVLLVTFVHVVVMFIVNKGTRVDNGWGGGEDF